MNFFLDLASLYNSISMFAKFVLECFKFKLHYTLDSRNNKYNIILAVLYWCDVVGYVKMFTGPFFGRTTVLTLVLFCPCLFVKWQVIK